MTSVYHQDTQPAHPSVGGLWVRGDGSVSVCIENYPGPRFQLIGGPTAALSPVYDTVTADLVGNVTGYIILPIADPLVAGALWNNAGTVTVSAGPA